MQASLSSQEGEDITRLFQCCNFPHLISLSLTFFFLATLQLLH